MMAILVLSKSKRNVRVQKIRCLIRKIYVEAYPEENVRQKLLFRMIEDLGYPASYLVVEKELQQMPHLHTQGKSLPERRADIVCFAKNIHSEPLYPLLLIECKVGALTMQVINQVTGYNHYIGAYFVAIANQDAMKTGWYDATLRRYTFVPFLPSYQQLLNAVK